MDLGLKLIVKQQIMTYEARRTGVINNLYGNEALKAQREQAKMKQEADIRADEAALKYQRDWELLGKKIEGAKAIEKIKVEKSKKTPKEQTFEYVENARRKSYLAYKKAMDDGDIEEAEAQKDIYRAQTDEIRKGFPKKQITEFMKKEEPALGVLDKFKEWFK